MQARCPAKVKAGKPSPYIKTTGNTTTFSKSFFRQSSRQRYAKAFLKLINEHNKHCQETIAKLYNALTEKFKGCKTLTESDAYAMIHQYREQKEALENSKFTISVTHREYQKISDIRKYQK